LSSLPEHLESPLTEHTPADGPAKTSPTSPTANADKAPATLTPAQRQSDAELRSYVEIAIAAAEDRKAENTQAFFVGEVIGITDWFIITSGTNPRQVRAIVENIEAELTKQMDIKPVAIEGLDSLGWVLMDFGGIVVHVFHDEIRDYYNLERLWSDVPTFQPVGA